MAMLVVSAAFALRVFRLGAYSFWGDEVDTLYAGMHAIYFHPPLFLVLARAWAAVFSSDAMLRLLSAIFSTVAVAAAWSLGRRVTRSIPIAFWSSVLVAVNPCQVYYGREFRMYSLMAFLTAVSWVMFFKWMQDGGARRAVTAILLGAAILYTHHYGVIFLMGQGMAALFMKPRKKVLAKLAVYTGTLILIYIPYIRLVMYFSSRMIRSNYWAYPVNWNTPFYLMRCLISHFEPTLAVAGISILIALCFLFFGMRSRPPAEWRYLVVFGFLAPILIGGFISAVLPTSALVARYLIFTSIPLCVALAPGVHRLASYRSGMLLILLFLGLQLWAVTLQYRNTFLGPEPREVRERRNYRGAARVILDNFREGDCYGTTCVSGSHPAWYYLAFRGDLPAGRMLDIEDRYRHHMEKKYGLMEYLILHYPFVSPVNIEEMIASENCRRMWLYESQWASGIRPGDFYYEHRIRCRKWLAARYPLLGTWTFKGVEVRLFDLQKPKMIAPHNE